MTDIERDYRVRYVQALIPIAKRLEQYIQQLLKDQPRIDRISARPKSVDRFVAKANKMTDEGSKYQEPLHQIQDQVGARIITFYTSDVDKIGHEILRYFHSIESKDLVPESEWEFGYFGQHHILVLPPDVVDDGLDAGMVPPFFELQIKTLFQHAWSEANHDLGYKPGQRALQRDELRQLAFTSAQAWGADRVFNELFEKQKAPDGAV